MTKLKIEMLGTSFTIQATEDKEYLEKLIGYYKRITEDVNKIESVKNPLQTAILSGIMICDELYKEKLEVERIENPGIAATPITLLEDQYFVLGDNRNSSEDSRYESVGFVSSQDILGKVWAKYPFKRG